MAWRQWAFRGKGWKKLFPSSSTTAQHCTQVQPFSCCWPWDQMKLLWMTSNFRPPIHLPPTYSKPIPTTSSKVCRLLKTNRCHQATKQPLDSWATTVSRSQLSLRCIHCMSLYIYPHPCHTRASHVSRHAGKGCLVAVATCTALTAPPQLPQLPPTALAAFVERSSSAVSATLHTTKDPANSISFAALFDAAGGGVSEPARPVVSCRLNDAQRY